MHGPTDCPFHDGQHVLAFHTQFVLCAGGLEIARILLNSDHERRGGLGNTHDLVGRDHPNGIVASVSAPNADILQDRFRLLYRGRFHYFPKFALDEVQQRSAQALNANAHLVFEYDDQPGLGVMRAVQAGVAADRNGAPGSGSDRARDAEGLRAPGPRSHRSGDLGECADRCLADKLVDGYHHAGTTRMAQDPRHGVVNSDCALFDVPNLYACGGSVFPTSGYANPTLTIAALAIRLADHLRHRLHAPIAVQSSGGRSELHQAHRVRIAERDSGYPSTLG